MDEPTLTTINGKLDVIIGMLKENSSSSASGSSANGSSASQGFLSNIIPSMPFGNSSPKPDSVATAPGSGILSAFKSGGGKSKRKRSKHTKRSRRR